MDRRDDRGATSPNSANRGQPISKELGDRPTPLQPTQTGPIVSTREAVVAVCPAMVPGPFLNNPAGHPDRNHIDTRIQTAGVKNQFVVESHQ